jgi:hypothetical protein
MKGLACYWRTLIITRKEMITVTILSENTVRGAGLLGEHGLAYWLDTGTHRVLFDTGQGMALQNNATKLGIGEFPPILCSVRSSVDRTSFIA